MQAYTAHMNMETAFHQRSVTEENSNLIIGYGTNMLSRLSRAKVLPFLTNNYYVFIFWNSIVETCDSMKNKNCY
jgi:hypothetical protein